MVKGLRTANMTDSDVQTQEDETQKTAFSFTRKTLVLYMFIYFGYKVTFSRFLWG